MPTSEQHPTRCVDPPPAESTCDAICQAGPCCQIAQECELERNPVQYVVGDCVPDGQGGCKRSAPGSPSGCCSPSGHDRPQGVLLWVIVLPDLLIVCARLLESCCESDSVQMRAISSRDQCCVDSRPCCTLDSPGTDCRQGRCLCLLW